LRRAGVWAALAFEHARRGEPAQPTAQRALDELAAVDKNELSDEDQIEYAAAALRVAASRWAAEPVGTRPGALTVATGPGEPGETCVLLGDARHTAKNPLLKRCTFGIVWAASATSSRS